MSIDFDFLAGQQPTEFTVRALWYLDHFAQGGVWSDGFAFEKQLRACQLDYTLGSLHRIDNLLDHIRKLKPNPETFFRQPENQQFLFTLAFYCGEMRGRLVQNAPVWYNWQTFVAENYGMEKLFTNVVQHELVACFRSEGEQHTYFPLIAILDRLFPEGDTPEKSVYDCIITNNSQQYDLNDVLPQAPIQGLNFNLQDAIANTPIAELPYLQILPPKWLQGNDLMGQINNMATLYNTGRVVWAALVQADHQLFQHNAPASSTASIIYDKSGRTPAATLRHYAKELFSLREENQSDNSQLTQYIAHLSNEQMYFSGSIPKCISHMDLRGASVLVWRLHLPNAILTLPIFPIIVTEQTDEVMLLPAKYWVDTSFYRDWLREQAIINEQKAQDQKKMLSSQEIVSAFRQYVQSHDDFWLGYTELLSPQLEELPDIGTRFVEQETFIQYETDQRFLMRCRNVAQSEYRRWYEYSEHFVSHTDSTNDAIKRLPENIYTRLHALDLQPFLSLLTEPFDEVSLKNSRPLPKVAALFEEHHLSSLYVAKLVQFLLSQGTISLSKVVANENSLQASEQSSVINTTATLYLALMYLTGKFVQQTIEEGASWLNLAVSLGDYRAIRWVAELVIQLPELAPVLLKQKLISEMSPLSIRLMNASSMGKLSYSIADVNEQEKAYIHHPEAQMELARQYFQLAEKMGDKNAKARLAELIEQKKLPEKAREQRFEHIQFWIIDYFAQKGVDITHILNHHGTREQEAHAQLNHAKNSMDNEPNDIWQTSSIITWQKSIKWSTVVIALGLLFWLIKVLI